jgi:hypothetical protein
MYSLQGHNDLMTTPVLVCTEHEAVVMHGISRSRGAYHVQAKLLSRQPIHLQSTITAKNHLMAWIPGAYGDILLANNALSQLVGVR